ncbi:MAG: hypothetical protein MNPFHGCM_00453 [Gemmatimonadaceae bacterium]|nr:hypothetical protein [Gemmatimonadaceae bacterium]
MATIFRPPIDRVKRAGPSCSIDRAVVDRHWARTAVGDRHGPLSECLKSRTLAGSRCWRCPARVLSLAILTRFVSIAESGGVLADGASSARVSFLPFSYGSESGALNVLSFGCDQRPHNLSGKSKPCRTAFRRRPVRRPRSQASRPANAMSLWDAESIRAIGFSPTGRSSLAKDSR